MLFRSSFLSGGVRGLMNFGANTAVSNATTAVVYKVDQSFRPRVRPTLAIMFHGGNATLHTAYGTKYRPRDRDGSLRFKRARYRSYEMVRARPPR